MRSAPTRSKRRLASLVASWDRERPRCISGSPATGRIRTRSLETSVTLGATMICTLAWSSSSQARRRSWVEELTAPAVKNTMSGWISSTTARTSSLCPSTSTPVEVRSRPA